MTTEHGNPNWDVHSIDFLSNPALAGLPDEFQGMGVLRISEAGTPNRATVLVEHEYAITAITARRELEGFIPLSATATRFMRTGWPEEWGPDLNPAWATLYPSRSQA